MGRKHMGPIPLEDDVDGPKHTLTEWCAKFGMAYHTVYNRLRHGMSLSEALRHKGRVTFKQEAAPPN